MIRQRRALIPLLALVLEAACGESQAPSLNGPSFLTANIDGRPWAADTGPNDLYAPLGPQRVIVSARRHTDQPAAVEVLGVEFGTDDIFAERSYPLAATIDGFATYRLTTVPPGGPAEAYYSTTPEHVGFLTVEASSREDSVVTGRFTFEAVPLVGTVTVHRITGRFRLRYTTTVP